MHSAAKGKVLKHCITVNPDELCVLLSSISQYQGENEQAAQSLMDKLINCLILKNSDDPHNYHYWESTDLHPSTSLVGNLAFSGYTCSLSLDPCASHTNIDVFLFGAGSQSDFLLLISGISFY